MNYEQLLEKLIKEDERILCVTAENRAAIRNLPPKIGQNFIDVGIAEQTMIGMCAGLAKRGRIPICHALATFLTMRAFEFIRTDVGIPNLPVKIMGAFAGFLSEANGATHQAIEDVALMRGIPGMHVVMPADEQEMLESLPLIANSPHPTYLRYVNNPAPVEHKQPFELGKAEVIRDGSDITLMSYGFILRETVKAADILEQKDYSVRLINLRTVTPIDEAVVLAALKETKLVVTVEDHFLTGGLYSILAELLLKNSMTANVLPIALDNKWFVPSLLPKVLEHEGFTGEQIAAKAEKAFKK
jgi:transketolase